MNENTSKTAVIFARVSSISDRQDTTRQVRDLESFANREGLTIVATYEEHISGGKKNEERQVLTECINYCISNHVNLLLLSELSRLGRSTLQVLRSLELLHEAKVSVYIQNLGLYSLQDNGQVNPIASILITVLAEFSNIERSNIAYRLNSGKQQYVQNGGKLGRHVGYRISEQELRERYPKEIALLKKGYSVRAVAELQGISKTTVQKLKKLFINQQ